MCTLPLSFQHERARIILWSQEWQLSRIHATVSKRMKYSSPKKRADRPRSCLFSVKAPRALPDWLRDRFQTNDGFLFLHLFLPVTLQWVGENLQPPPLRVICKSPHFEARGATSTAGISASCCETVESIIRESRRVFSGSVMLSRRSRSCSCPTWKKDEFLPICVSDEATKPCFISALGKIFAFNIPKTGSLLRLANQNRIAAIPDSVCYGFKKTKKTNKKPPNSDMMQRHSHTPILHPVREIGHSWHTKAVLVHHKTQMQAKRKARNSRTEPVGISRSPRSPSRQCK